jgi:hypothetical protein
VTPDDGQGTPETCVEFPEYKSRHSDITLVTYVGYSIRYDDFSMENIDRCHTRSHCIVLTLSFFLVLLTLDVDHAECARC